MCTHKLIETNRRAYAISLVSQPFFFLPSHYEGESCFNHHKGRRIMKTHFVFHTILSFKFYAFRFPLKKEISNGYA
jgi:hypothetical protein